VVSPLIKKEFIMKSIKLAQPVCHGTKENW
jgi:hypothetical protein